jgi:hypothetical protein
MGKPVETVRVGDDKSLSLHLTTEPKSFKSLGTSTPEVGLGVTVGVGVGLTIATPLFQTNFFPDLMQE